jgi:hypothetical protein
MPFSHDCHRRPKSAHAVVLAAYLDQNAFTTLWLPISRLCKTHAVDVSTYVKRRVGAEPGHATRAATSAGSTPIVWTGLQCTRPDNVLLMAARSWVRPPLLLANAADAEPGHATRAASSAGSTPIIRRSRRNRQLPTIAKQT